MDGVKPPQGLVLSGDGANFKAFVQRFKFYLQAVDLEEADEKRKIALFLNCAGEEAIDVYNTFQENEFGTLEDVITEFQDYLEPKKNLLYVTYNFFNLRQEEGEVFDHFYMRVKSVAKKCELNDLEDRLTTMVIVIGIRDTSLKERMLRDPDLKLQQAVEICRASELGKKQIQNIEAGRTEQVNLVKKKQEKPERSYGNRGARPKEDLIDCYRCGKRHQKKNCPAFDRKCAECGVYGHFAVMCRRKKPERNRNRRRVNAVTQDSQDSEDGRSEEEFCVGSVQTVSAVKKEQWYEKILVNGSGVLFKLDTGSECNTLTLEQFNKIKKDTDILEKSDSLLVVYNEEQVDPVGSITLDCVVKDQEVRLRFSIIDAPVQPLLGLPDVDILGLVKRVNTTQAQVISEKEKFLKENREVFVGLGRIGKYKIKVKEDAEPVVKPIRRVPQAIKSRLKETLDNYESRDIIEKVTTPTPWCNNLVVVEKPDKSLRLCLDPKELNNSILRENYPIASPEDIYNKTSKKRKSFSTGQNILIQNGTDKVWKPGQIMKHEGIRSYVIKNEKGNLVRRNEKHIIKSRNKFVIKSEDCDGPGCSDPGNNNVIIGRDASLSGLPSPTQQRVLEQEVQGYVTRSGRQIKKPSYLKDYV